MAREGASVTVADINEANAKGVAEEIESVDGTAYPFTVDVTNKDDADRMVAETVERFGKLDILVNNAGIAIIASLMDTDEAAWEALMNVNAKGVLLCSQAAARQMITQGNGGASSTTRLEPPNRTRQRHTAWCLCCQQARCGRAHQAFGLELSPHGILVNCVCPGIVDTPMWELIDREVARLEGVPVGSVKARATRRIPSWTDPTAGRCR